MMIKRFYTIAAITTLLCLGFSAQAFAQTTEGSSAPATSVGGSPAALSQGTWGLSLGVLGNNPYANNTANISYFFSDRLNLGLSLGFRLDDGDDNLAGINAGIGGGEWGLAIAPTLRYYFPRGHRVTPYFFAKVNLAFVDQEPNDDYFGFAGGLGAEFFAYDYFSIGGFIGLNINVVEDFGLGLFTSGMLANFYF